MMRPKLRATSVSLSTSLPETLIHHMYNVLLITIGIWSELQALCKGHRFVGPLPKLKKYLFSSLIVVPDTTQSLSHEGAPILVQLVERTNVADEALVATLGIYAEPPTMDSDGYWKEIQIERTKTQEKGNTINIPLLIVLYSKTTETNSISNNRI
ncbi:hypothetical protein SFRURICE_017049 [Spodoptera frugiperda]|nr:hypothetical protein SFRURICE_017049 [Spodoptera frugiperda]